MVNGGNLVSTTIRKWASLAPAFPSHFALPAILALPAFLAMAAFIALPAIADWEYRTTDAMVTGADVIAIVDIGPIQDTKARPKDMDFHQMAQASVEKTLKGSPPKSITIYGGINCKGFVACVPDVSLSSGRSLVFLRRKNGGANGFISANADRGIQKINSDTILWRDDANRGGKQMKLSEVIALIQSK